MTKTKNGMKTKTATFINLSDIATILGRDVRDLDSVFSWGDTDMPLVSLHKILRVLTDSEEESVTEALFDVIGASRKAFDTCFVNLAD